MNYLIIGASAGLGRALAQKLACAGNNLVLLASDQRDLQAMASDLGIRHYIKVETVAADVALQAEFLEALAGAIDRLGGLDGIFCPIGAVHPQDRIPFNPSLVQHINNVNYSSVVSVISRFWDVLIERPHQTVIVGFGSVAFIRGRNSNACYAAAKRALSSFFESLRHAAVSTNILVQFYVLGYLDTNQAFGKRTLLPRANPNKLAGRIYKDLQKDFGVVYYPGYWRLIHLILRMLPWRVFKHLSF
jgi:NAD(P)-dependent dehydrogenase (short-subunit alcohol dehydrogenase family)